MSLAAYVWCTTIPMRRLSLAGFRVLMHLADRADELGYGAYPSVPTMADSLGCSTRTVQRALRELVDESIIREGDQRYVSHLDARYRPTVYDVLTTALVQTERIDAEREARGDSPVTPGRSRGDRSRHPGVTTVVATKDIRKEPSLEPSYQDTPRSLSLVTARESEDQ